jgi:hypothetical protein
MRFPPIGRVKGGVNEATNGVQTPPCQHTFLHTPPEGGNEENSSKYFY